ncbi:glycosyltransferase [Myxococcota bacterium]|nr:glycosyltransferase [Myxococcota bacterium]
MRDRARPSICMLLHSNYDTDARVKREARHLVARARVRVVQMAERDQEAGVREEAGVEIERFQLATRDLPQSTFYWGIKFVELTLRMAWRASRTHPSAYHAHDLIMVPAAILASWMRRAPVIYDSHELWSETEQTPAQRRFWFAIERWALPRVAAVIAVNQSRAEVMVRELGSPTPFVIPNYPRHQPVAALPSGETSPLREFVREDGRADALILLYQGVIAETRNLDRVIAAMAHVRSPVVLVLLGGTSAVSRKFAAQAESLGIADRVLIHDRIDSDLLPTWTVGADAGLVTYAETPRNNYLCAPNKLFEYCMSGVPVVGCAFPEVARVMQAYPIGESFEDSNPKTIAAAIDRLMGEPERLARAREATLVVREKFHWDAVAPELDRLYDRVFAGERRVVPE